MNFNKQIIGQYENMQGEKMFLWEFWTDENQHIFNLYKEGQEPTFKSGGYLNLNAFNQLKNYKLTIYNEVKGGLK